MFLLQEIKCKEQELLSCSHSLTELCLTFGITTVPEDERSEDELVGNVHAFSGQYPVFKKVEEILVWQCKLFNST